jgi:hypothetical protein
VDTEIEEMKGDKNLRSFEKMFLEFQSEFQKAVDQTLAAMDPRMDHFEISQLKISLVIEGLRGSDDDEFVKI